jgi:hypothetical protein
LTLVAPRRLALALAKLMLVSSNGITLRNLALHRRWPLRGQRRAPESIHLVGLSESSPATADILSLSGVHSSFGLKPLPVAFWTAGLAAATWIGYRYFPETRISFDPVKGTFSIPGSWTPLLVIMAIFCVKYTVAVMASLHVGMVRAPGFTMALSLAYGVFSGYFAARALSLLACAKRSGMPSEQTPLQDAT